MKLNSSKGSDTTARSWQAWMAVSVLCGLSVVGCSRSDKATDTTADNQSAEQTATAEQSVSGMACDDSQVQQRLIRAIKDNIRQQAHMVLTKHAANNNLSIDTNAVDNKTDAILVEIQNPVAMMVSSDTSAANIANTTCQASLSLTLPSEDLFRASQVYAAVNEVSLQQRLAANGILLNNNMLVDDKFTYVAAAQAGQTSARIAGNPFVLQMVADITANSAIKSELDAQQAAREQQAQQQRAREQAARAAREQAQRQAASTSSSYASGSSSNVRDPSNHGVTTAPVNTSELSTPSNDNIDMVIVEEDTTY